MSLLKLKLPQLLRFENGSQVSLENWRVRRLELIKILSENEYGFTPKNVKTRWKTVDRNENDLAGKAEYRLVEITFNTPKGEFSFPLHLVIPKAEKKPQLILHIAFRDLIPDRYYCVEEICDRGFATAMFCYTDITSDDNDFTNGLAGMFENERSSNEWGKIGMWAFAASRAMDFLSSLDEIDTTKISVAGHSRLGKTALWTGAQDERFFAAISNNSGSSGAALARGKTRDSESVEVITRVFEYWFCKNYQKYACNEESMPFDQHFLIAAMAPRRVYVCSAKEDIWACPKSEFLSCAAAGEAWNLLGVGENLPKESDFTGSEIYLNGGRIGYHLREGLHFMSRYDWKKYIDFLERA